MADGQQAIDGQIATTTSTENLFGTREYLVNDYQTRAVAAQMGIYGNSKEEALYVGYQVDADGAPLDTASHRYVLRFPPGQLPPVHAFWSLTMYDLPGRLLVANPLNRYLVNSPMLPQLQRDDDGGLTLYVQHQSPGPERESNWLPAPNGHFFGVIRCYWPQQAVLDKSWTAPSMRRVE
jgi:hypothetical protein